VAGRTAADRSHMTATAETNAKVGALIRNDFRNAKGGLCTVMGGLESRRLWPLSEFLATENIAQTGHGNCSPLNKETSLAH